MIWQKNHCFMMAAALVVLYCVAYFALVPLVGEEAHYASIAWQMLIEKNWLIPRFGDHIYLEKMPLLFWCLNAGWRITTHWPWQMIFPMIFALLTLFYTQKLAQAFFSNNSIMIALTPLVLVCMPFFLDNLGLLRFDILLTLFNVLACCCFIFAKQLKRYYVYFIVINLLGFLTKGPVFYIFTLVESLLFCFYCSERPAKYLFIWWGAIIFSALCLCFCLFFIFGWQEIKHLLLSQIISRMTAEHLVAKPWWDYMVLFPCVFLPWLLFLPLWRENIPDSAGEKNDKAHHFFIAICIVCLIIFSCFKTKEARYLLPLTPFIAMIISYYLSRICLIHSQQRRKQIIGFLALSFLVTTSCELMVAHKTATDKTLMPTVQFIKKLTDANIPVASTASIVLDMQFSGRWTVPMTMLNNKELLQHWANENPKGWLVTTQPANTTIEKPYAQKINGCFEQTYDHLKYIIQVCPIAQGAA